jgi:DNA helicase-2/ATP-dependent DNA helicase PcrA
MSDPEQMSEERRLCYVAITRAKEELFISYAKNRMMYGRTAYGNLSCFIRDEVPEHLTVRQKPRAVPPRGVTTGAYVPKSSASSSLGAKSPFGEMNRKAFGSTPSAKSGGAQSFGVEKLSVGTRVRHAAFGEGTIVFAKDMGGDVLYQVKFDNGLEKKLMATFAKLQKI